jgi:hypothetical protein
MISGAIENAARIAAEKSGGCSYAAKLSLAALAGIQSHRGVLGTRGRRQLPGALLSGRVHGTSSTMFSAIRDEAQKKRRGDDESQPRGPQH